VLISPPNPDTDEQKKRFAEKPELFLRYSKMIESELNVRFKFILNGTPEAEGAREVSIHAFAAERKK
jgi:hypothetical protein